MSWERPRRAAGGRGSGRLLCPHIRSGGRECGGAKASAFAAECAYHPLALRAAPQSSTTERGTPLLERGYECTRCSASHEMKWLEEAIVVAARRGAVGDRLEGQQHAPAAMGGSQTDGLCRAHQARRAKCDLPYLFEQVTRRLANVFLLLSKIPR